MYPDLPDAQHIGDLAGVLACRAAETAQREIADVLTPFDRYLAYRVGHVFDRDGQESRGSRFRARRDTAVR